MTDKYAILASLIQYLATTAALFFGWKALLAYWTERLKVYGCEVLPGLRGVTPREEHVLQQERTS